MKNSTLGIKIINGLSILFLILLVWLFFFSDILKDFLLWLEIFIKNEKEYVYIFAFLSAVAEGTIILGIVPGTTYIITLGVFWARGDIDPFILFPVVILGAVLGDFLGYSIGKFFAKPIKKKYQNDKNYLFSIKFILKHGGKSIFLARFITGIKELIPFIAGVLSMEMRVFIIWNFLGAVGWSVLWILVGYIAGDYITETDEVVKWVGIVLLALIAVPIFVFYKKNKKNIL